MNKVTVKRADPVPHNEPIESVTLESAYGRKLTFRNSLFHTHDYVFTYGNSPNALTTPRDIREFAEALIEFADQAEGN